MTFPGAHPVGECGTTGTQAEERRDMKTTPLDRFRAKVRIQADGCLIWTAATDRNGYGGFRAGSRWVRAHRWYYQYINGPVPDELVIDHLCRVRSCVNPDHLRAVTFRENQLAPGSESSAASNAFKTHCSRGHRFAPANMYENTYRRYRARKCRACTNANSRANHDLKHGRIPWTEARIQAYSDRKYAEYVAALGEVQS